MDSDQPATVVVTVAAAAWRSAIDDLEARALLIVRAALEHASVEDWARRGEISLLLSDDEELRDLNGRYRDRDRPTNVLSFPAIDFDEGRSSAAPLPGPVLLGDIAMSFQRLSIEAGERGKPLLDHFAHLLVHGTLHLLGYDHEEDDQAVMMERLEESVLSGLGMAPPYAPEDDVVRSEALS